MCHMLRYRFALLSPIMMPLIYREEEASFSSQSRVWICCSKMSMISFARRKCKSHLLAWHSVRLLIPWLVYDDLFYFRASALHQSATRRRTACRSSWPNCQSSLMLHRLLQCCQPRCQSRHLAATQRGGGQLSLRANWMWHLRATSYGTIGLRRCCLRKPRSNLLA